MKYAVVGILAFGICLLLGIFVTRLITRKAKDSQTPSAQALSSKPVHILMPVAFTAVFLMAAGLTYLNTTNRADDVARACLQSDQQVSVTRTMNGYLFDGEGTACALVFYPGGFVEPIAYAPLLHALAADGIDAFLIAPPFDFALMNVDAAAELMATYDYDAWYVGGHSLGGIAASSFAADHSTNGVVLLASYPTQQIAVPLLLIRGSQDGVLNSTAYEEARPLWPDGAQEVIIEGGNHAYYGNYGEQSGDGVAALSRERQQELTEQAIVAFINETMG